MTQMLSNRFCSFLSQIGNLCCPTYIFIHSKALVFALQVLTRELFPFIQMVLVQCLQQMQREDIAGI